MGAQAGQVRGPYDTGTCPVCGATSVRLRGTDGRLCRHVQGSALPSTTRNPCAGSGQNPERRARTRPTTAERVSARLAELADPEPGRGQCRHCPRVVALTRDGRVRRHNNDRVPCAGVGYLPAGVTVSAASARTVQITDLAYRSGFLVHAVPMHPGEAEGGEPLTGRARCDDDVRYMTPVGGSFAEALAAAGPERGHICGPCRAAVLGLANKPTVAANPARRPLATGGWR
jgi:hypothetical protein